MSRSQGSNNKTVNTAAGAKMGISGMGVRAEKPQAIMGTLDMAPTDEPPAADGSRNLIRITLEGNGRQMVFLVDTAASHTFVQP
ncbi:hypothetical protein PR048_011195 [Dryococelus australis]|uniref:Uncharacterized protein n=1 Tax=Dryococelus australis TaxID=614101 RepID=A0ABQ9HKY1_9NEOP|nr:hypothetical protein PR048_011195 [Dryococelus australis]